MFEESYFYYAVSSIVIGVVGGVLLSGTYGGIPVTLFMLLYEAFLCYSVKRQNGNLWPQSRCYLIYGGILSITLSLTNNRMMLVTSLLGILMLLTLFLYHQFDADEGWGFARVFSKLLEAAFSPLNRMFQIFSDGVKSKERHEINSVYIYIGVGILIAVPSVIAVSAILMSADGLFERVMEAMFGWISLEIDFGKIIKFAFLTCFSYAFLAFMMTRHEEGAAPRTVKHQPVTAIVVYGVLTFVYAFFCIVQLGYLFVQKDSVMNGYANSAREGFFQLTFVGILNLLLVINGVAHLQKNKLLDAIMLVMSVCTYGMMLSAAIKMYLYVRNYHLTVLRLMVSWAIVVIAVIFAGVIKNIYDEKLPLFKYAMHVFCICFILLAFARPDYVVAQYNLKIADDYEDFNYLRRNLSIDIVPVVEAVREKYAGDEGYDELVSDLEYMVREEKENAFVLGGLSELTASRNMGDLMHEFVK